MDKEQKHRLISVLEEQMYRVEDLCGSLELSAEIKVHEIRKSFKRINALFRLFPASLDEDLKAFLQPVKALARKLTVARETTVNLQFLRTMCAENECFSLPDARDLEEQLDRENRSSLQSLIEGESIFGIIGNLMKEARHGFLDSLNEVDFLIDISFELAQSFEKSRNLFLTSASEYHPVEYHELRKRMKVLWYQFEFIHPGQAEVPGTLSEKLHSITDRLGDDHDWYIFLEEIEDEKYIVSPAFKTLLEKNIHRYQEANLEVLNNSLAEFFRESNNEFLRAVSKM